jgi:hypothetical protein
LEPAPHFPANAEGRERCKAFASVPERGTFHLQAVPMPLQTAVVLEYAA